MLKPFRLKKINTNETSDLNKRMKGTGIGKYVGKCKRLFFFQIFKISLKAKMVTMNCGVNNIWRSKRYDNNSLKM